MYGEEGVDVTFIKRKREKVDVILEMRTEIKISSACCQFMDSELYRRIYCGFTC